MGTHRLYFKDREFDVTVTKAGDQYQVSVGDKTFTAEIRDDQARLYSGSDMTVTTSAHNKRHVFVGINGRQVEFEIPSEDGGASDHGHGGEKDKLFAPMPGKIVKIMVSVGDEVSDKQPLAIVESMKMENQLLSAASGIVKAVNFKAGDQVDTERAIIELELAE